MPRTVVIVESPKKARTIQQMLAGDSFVVLASGGHICDLPVAEMGVDTASFELTYQLTDRGKVSLARIKSAISKGAEVILATDPDREGEAIAWHLATLLKLKQARRATFHEITDAAVSRAIAACGRINKPLVDARQARRGSDRLIGYSVSRPLSEILGRKGLSTGRVQGAAVALLVEQERRIRNHRQRDHYSVQLHFASAEHQWTANWMIPDDLEDEEELKGNALLNYSRTNPICASFAHASAAANSLQVVVKEFARRPETRLPPPPLITSTLQQQAANRWGYDPEVTMKAAQDLFDAGYITYHRTDNPNVSDVGSSVLSKFAASQGLPIAAEPNRWPSPPNAQEGHEAIRPTEIARNGAGDTEVEQNIYRLIRLRALQSQLAPALLNVCEIVLADEQDRYRYRASTRELVEPGYQSFASFTGAGDLDNPEEDVVQSSSAPLPALAIGSIIAVADSQIGKHKTAAPRRYSIATLMRKLEVLGIGRPATYASIFATLFSRAYAEKAGKQLVPTTICEQIYDAVYPAFSYADLAYTRSMEEALDDVAAGKTAHTEVMREMWRTLEKEMQAFQKKAVQPIADLAAPQEPEKACPKCGRSMRAVSGKYGRFWSCSGYGQHKACTHTENISSAPSVLPPPRR